MFLSMETWKSVVGYEGYYEVSDDGRVRSMDRTVPHSNGTMQPRQGGPLKTRPNRLGYITVWLSRDAKPRLHTVHSLVAAAFIGPRPAGLEVRHRDGDPADNRARMLSYGTHSQNMRDRAKHGTDWNARKTHCPQNHPYDEENTSHKNGRRHCRACARDYARRYQAAGRRKDRPTGRVDD